MGLLDEGAGLVVLALVDDRGVGRRVVLLVVGAALVVVGVVLLERAGGVDVDVGVSSCGTMTIGGSGISTLTGGAAAGVEVTVAVTVRSGIAGEAGMTGAAGGWLCQVDLAPVGRFHSAPPEWGPEPLESGVWMGGRGCAVWLRRLVGIASRCVRMPSS